MALTLKTLLPKSEKQLHEETYLVLTSLKNKSVMNRFKILNYVLKETRWLCPAEPSLLSSLASSRCWRNTPVRYCSDDLVAREKSENEPPMMNSAKEVDLSDYGSAVIGNFNFQMHADRSPIIQKFIKLGVDLHRIEKHPKQAEYLLTLTESKIEQYVNFLKINGVPDDMIGSFITRNPAIFQEDLDDLDIRINYLKSKKFNKEMISKIITTNPKWLSKTVRSIDERLGYLQETYRLKGDDVRKIVTKEPSLAIISKHRLLLSGYALREELFLNTHELKRIIISEPKLLRRDPYDMIPTYEYLLNVMKVSRDLILQQPKVLTYRRFQIQERHKFLESLGRAQYCHLLPGYVSLMDLVETSDAEFCERIAKTSEQLFNSFLKTM